MSQVTHEILSNMELSPEYSIELTSKREVPAEQSIEDLMKEWEDKENVVEPEKVNKNKLKFTGVESFNLC